jgi:hypothetical protein
MEAFIMEDLVFSFSYMSNDQSKYLYVYTGQGFKRFGYRGLKRSSIFLKNAMKLHHRQGWCRDKTTKQKKDKLSTRKKSI